jgi:hypothetical protein
LLQWSYQPAFSKQLLSAAKQRQIVNIPYTQECNDVAMMKIQHHKATELYDRAMGQFEQIYKN